jgi:nitroreductase
MDLSEVMRTAGAAREFTPEPVEAAVLHRVLDHARFAPSGGNRQGWDVIVVQDPHIRSAVRDLCVLGWREYMAHVEQGLVPFAPNDEGRWTGPAVDLDAARTVERPAPFVDTLDTVPVMLVVTARLDQLAVQKGDLCCRSAEGQKADAQENAGQLMDRGHPARPRPGQS